MTGTNKNFSGLQSMHDPNANGGQFLRWNVTSVAFAVYLASDATGLVVSDWTITNSGSSHDGGQYSVVAVAGASIARMTLVNSAGCYIYPPATGSC